MDHFYRFRPISRLLSGPKELENQTVYFAPPWQLNDPMEGYKDLFWAGDEILWKNLLKHYLTYISQILSLIIIGGENYDRTMDRKLVYWSRSNFPTQQLKEIHEKIFKLFFSFEEVAAIPRSLATRKFPVRRDELIFYLRSLHPLAIASALQVFKDQGLAGPGIGFDMSKFSNDTLLINLPNMIEAAKAFENESQSDIERLFMAAGFTHLQMDILNRIEISDSPKEKEDWNHVIFDIPQEYVKNLDLILYGDWFAACFVGNPNHAAMWGNYGDGHQGVCLKYRALANSSGRFILNLYRQVGASGGPQGTKVIYGWAPHEFHEVKYSKRL